MHYKVAKTNKQTYKKKDISDTGTHPPLGNSVTEVSVYFGMDFA